jgi:iron-regulated transporter 1
LRSIGDPGRKADRTARELVDIRRNIPIKPVLSIPTRALAVLSAFLPGSPMDLNFFITGSTSSLGNSTDGDDSVIEVSSLTFDEFVQKYSSASVFLLGIILARFGLWIVDLTINQILQERVAEDKRGVVNGVKTV